jgi:hypothetical protein
LVKKPPITIRETKPWPDALIFQDVKTADFGKRPSTPAARVRQDVDPT